MEENAGIVTDTRKHCSMTKKKKKGTINTSSGVIIAGMTSKESAIMETDAGIVTEMKEPDMTRKELKEKTRIKKGGTEIQDKVAAKTIQNGKLWTHLMMKGIKVTKRAMQTVTMVMKMTRIF